MVSMTYFTLITAVTVGVTVVNSDGTDFTGIYTVYIRTFRPKSEIF